MAQYRAMIHGSRGSASRLGHKTTGITADVNGWNLGVRVTAKYDGATNEDVFEVDITRGTNGGYPFNMDTIVTPRYNSKGELSGFVVREQKTSGVNRDADEAMKTEQGGA